MFRSLHCLIIALALLIFSLAAIAAVDVYQFDTEFQRQRYLQLSEELRCPKCQNQNLAGSDSQIAGDLRRELHRLLLEGQTDREIKDYMVARYGDFVLYKPPVQGSTLILWGLPIALLLIGGVTLIWVSRQRRVVTTSTDLSDDERSRLDGLLDDQPESTTTDTKEGHH